MRTIFTLILSFLLFSLPHAQNNQNKSPEKAVPVTKTEKPTSPSSSLSISKAVIALNVNDLEPENIADTFPAEVHRLFCFTQIKGATEPAEIQHRWYWKDELMGTVSLPIKPGNFRTYSSKSIPLGLTGDWRVSVVDPKDESIIGTVKFITQ